MAQNLNNGLNRFDVDELVLGTTDPSVSGLTAPELLDIMNYGQGVNRQDVESGIYITESTRDASVTTATEIVVWALYFDGATWGWIEYQTLSLADSDFANGHALAWKDHRDHGTLLKFYFQSTDSNAGITLHPIKKVILTSSHRDGESDLKEDFINWYSNTVEYDQAVGVTQLETKNFDGYKRIYHDLSSYAVGDTFSFTVEGSVDDAITYARVVEEFDCTYTWNASTETTTISFEVPYGPTSSPYDLASDSFHTWYSLGDAPAVPFQMTVNVGKGQESFWLPFWTATTDTETLNENAPFDGQYDFIIDWGDGSPSEHITNSDFQLYNNSQYNGSLTTRGGSQPDSDNTYNLNKKYFMYDEAYVLNHNYPNTTAGTNTYQISITAKKFGGFYFGGLADDNLNVPQDMEEFTTTEIINYHNGSSNPVMRSRAQVTSIDNWGSIPFQILDGSFNLCINLDVLADDVPDLSNLKRKLLRNTFAFCLNLSNSNHSISKWNVEKISSMGSMFYCSVLFNVPLNTNEVTLSNGDKYLAWNVRDNLIFAQMFAGSVTIGDTQFSQDLNYWNMNSATDLSYMFSDSSFNGSVTPEQVSPYALGWNPTSGLPSQWQSWSFINTTSSGARTLRAMFRRNHTFNQDVSEWTFWYGWNNSGISINTTEMFDGCSAFTSSVGRSQINIKDESGNSINVYAWDLTYVRHASRMFRLCQEFTGGNIGTIFPVGSIVENINEILAHCVKFNASVNDWDVSNVWGMSKSFKACLQYNQDMDNWVTDSAQYMDEMFAYAANFNGVIKSNPYDQAKWNTSNVEWFQEMFKGCVTFNQPLFGFDFSKAFSMHGLLKDCSSYDQDFWAYTYFQNGGNALGANAYDTGSASSSNRFQVKDPLHNHWMENFIENTAYSQSDVNNILSILRGKLADLTTTNVDNSNTPYVTYPNGQYVGYPGALVNLPVDPSSAAASDITALRAMGWYVGDFAGTLADGPTTYTVATTDFSWAEGDYTNLTRISGIIHPQNGGTYSTGEATVELERVYKNYQGADVEMTDLFELEDIGAPYPGSSNRYYIRTGGSYTSSQGGWVYDGESHAKHTDIVFQLKVNDSNGGFNRINLQGSLTNIAPSLTETPRTVLSGGSPNLGIPYNGNVTDSAGKTFKNFLHIKKSIFNNMVKNNTGLDRQIFYINIGPLTHNGSGNKIRNGSGDAFPENVEGVFPVLTSVRKRMGWYNQTDGHFESKGTGNYQISPNSPAGYLNNIGWDYMSRFKWVYTSNLLEGGPKFYLKYEEGTGTNNGYEITFNASSNKGMHNENNYWNNSHNNYNTGSGSNKKYYRKAWCYTIKYKLHDACLSNVSLNGPGRLQSTEYELNIIVRDNLK